MRNFFERFQKVCLNLNFDNYLLMILKIDDYDGKKYLSFRLVLYEKPKNWMTIKRRITHTTQVIH